MDATPRGTAWELGVFGAPKGGSRLVMARIRVAGGDSRILERI